MITWPMAIFIGWLCFGAGLGVGFVVTLVTLRDPKQREAAAPEPPVVTYMQSGDNVYKLNFGSRE